MTTFDQSDSPASDFEAGVSDANKARNSSIVLEIQKKIQFIEQRWLFCPWWWHPEFSVFSISNVKVPYPASGEPAMSSTDSLQCDFQSCSWLHSPETCTLVLLVLVVARRICLTKLQV